MYLSREGCFCSTYFTGRVSLENAEVRRKKGYFMLGEGERGGGTYASPRPASQPPRPIEMLPAINSAIPPYTTTLVSLNADKPAVSANGTVRPSERPIVKSESTRGSSMPSEVGPSPPLSGSASDCGCIELPYVLFVVGSSGEGWSGFGNRRFLRYTSTILLSG